MKNSSNAYTPKVMKFSREGDVMNGGRTPNDVTMIAPDSTRHNRSHKVSGTMRLGVIQPVDCIDTLPDEHYVVKLGYNAQFKPMVKPMLDSLITKSHSYFVSHKTMFGKLWERFVTRGQSGNNQGELPFYKIDDRMARVNGLAPSGTGSDTDLFYLIAFYSVALTRKCSIQDVIRWCSKKVDNVVDWDKPRVTSIINSVYGKGSLLDYFNVGMADTSALYTTRRGSVVGDGWTMPTCIPVAPLLAYKTVTNQVARLEDYAFDRFYEDYAFYETSILPFSNCVIGEGKDKMYNLNMDLENSLRRDPSIFVPIYFGAVFRHLDSIVLPNDNSIRDVIRFGMENHFELRGGSYLVTSGALDHQVGLKPLDPTDPYSGSVLTYSLTPSAAMLGWLLSLDTPPVETDYMTMIQPRTQRGLVESIGSSVSVGYTDTMDGYVLPCQLGDYKGRSNVAYLQSRSDSLVNNNELWTTPEGEIKHGGTVSGEKLPWRNTPFIPGGASVIPLPMLNAIGGGVDANTIRFVMKAAEQAEREQIVGEDYAKQLLMRFGISPKWAAFDKAIYLGGLTTYPKVDKITSTADTSEDTSDESKVLGGFVGDAYSNAAGEFTFLSDDYGLIITTMQCFPVMSYARFVNRNHYKLFDVNTWFTKKFEDLTEQHLYKEELQGNNTMRLARLVAGSLTNDEENIGSSVLGYIPRYQEYRSIPNTVHGEAIPSVGFEDETPWTFARDFNNPNALTLSGLLYHHPNDGELVRAFMFDPMEYPPMNFEINFGVDVLSKVGAISLPIQL